MLPVCVVNKDEHITEFRTRLQPVASKPA